MALFGAATTAATAGATIGDLKNDVAVASPPDDTVTDLVFSPTADILAVSSWDKKVRIYQIAGNGASEGKHIYEHDDAVFNVDFSKVRTVLGPSRAGYLPNEIGRPFPLT